VLTKPCFCSFFSLNFKSFFFFSEHTDIPTLTLTFVHTLNWYVTFKQNIQHKSIKHTRQVGTLEYYAWEFNNQFDSYLKQKELINRT